MNANDPTNFISYDAVKNLYTLNATDAKGQAVSTTFQPRSFDYPVTANGSPDPTEVKYSLGACYTSGCYDTGDKIITHTGAGSFKYTYTALEYSSSSSISFIGDNSSATFQAAVFGVATQSSAIPRTGSASYALDVKINNFTMQQGTGLVNFGAGTYSFNAAINDGVEGYRTTGTFTSSGKLATASNGFSGPVDVSYNTVSSSGTDKFAFHGALGGAFFGPAAQELGATFAAPATSFSTARDPGPVIGAVLGHR